MIRSTKGILFLLAIATLMPLRAQEVIIGLGNQNRTENVKRNSLKKELQDVVLELPFEDDFSYGPPYPDINLWAEDNAYVNNGYAVNPPSIGVATLDALDQFGSIYTNATIFPTTFIADTLTSYAINLDYPASDSIYFSFYYQPQGTGLQPKPEDSLCVDFYHVDSAEWVNVWRVPGDTLAPFKKAMLPVIGEGFLKEGFRFRFRNRASLPADNFYPDKRGNADHWNIDYVRLDRNRSFADTVIRDVAMQHPTPSMLVDYESIPWSHFELGFNTQYRSFVSLSYVNNDTATRNVSRYFSIEDELWGDSYQPSSSTTQDILPGSSTTADATSFYPFQFTRGDSASFLIKTWLRTDEFDNKINDTLYRRQIFNDYFAYDDGTAERSYGLRTQGTFAVKFESFIPDELGGIDIVFTQLLDSLSLDYGFRFMVWDDNDGEPGAIVYEDELEYNVEYSEFLNQFRRFTFSEKVPVEGTFYVGLRQLDDFLINVGLDINTPVDNNLFYNDGPGWKASGAPGILLLRPFVTSIIQRSNNPRLDQAPLRVYPVPANQFIRLEVPQDHYSPNFSYRIMDLSGRLIDAGPFSREISTGNLENGVYLIQVRSDFQRFTPTRFIIHR